ncbi:hypothetical protein CI610_03489 [invertebrate metagenome]|uniref:Uncharacterized protein n=1 Tax=invertebrate metagenome TaxID=1711999 RepID=A0A2H9T2Y3_9ZZZZ
MSDIIKKEGEKQKEGMEQEDVNVVFSSNTDNTYGARHPGNGLLDAIFVAYSEHLHLVLRPDDIFLPVVANFGRYLNKHAEEMRKFFVQHEGKRNLVVEYHKISFQDFKEDQWGDLLEMTSSEIDKNVLDKELKQWIVPEFTTTEEKDKNIARILLMGSMKEFFSYSFILGCGFPRVTLKGCKKDWESLRDKIGYLKKYQGELSKWVKLLEYVIDKFVAAFDGEVDELFWQSAVSSEPYGSGGERKPSGWYLVFAPFDKHGDYHLNDYDKAMSTRKFGNSNITYDNIATCGMTVPAQIWSPLGAYDISFYAGVNLFSYERDEKIISPNTGWGVILHKGKDRDSTE